MAFVLFFVVFSPFSFSFVARDLSQDGSVGRECRCGVSEVLYYYYYYLEELVFAVFFLVFVPLTYLTLVHITFLLLLLLFFTLS